MLVRKILETTLAAGSTSVSFTDSDIPNSLIRVYSTDPDLMPVEQSLTGTTLTITYEAQSSAKGIAVEMVKQGLEIVDNVTSSDTDKALSAKQGKVLKDAIDAIVIPTVPENITDLADVIFTDPTNGQVLKYQNGVVVNADESGGGSDVYATDETVIGTYLNKPLYRKVITGLSLSTAWQGTYYPKVDTSSLIANVKDVINSRAITEYSSGVSRNSIASIIVNNNSNVWSIATFDDITINILILEYTKTTD